MKKNDLAIILPVINCLKYTKGLLATIKTVHHYNLFLINNGSTDGTKEYFDKISQLNNIFVQHNKENLGVSASWNWGIKQAIKKFDAKYFFIPNNDILIRPCTIDFLIEAINYPKVLLASATDIAGRVSQAKEVATIQVPWKLELVEAPEFSCFMVKRETIDILKKREVAFEPFPGFFDERFSPAYFEDNDFHRRINLAGYRAVKSNRALYFHYGSRTIKENSAVKVDSDLGYAINAEYYDRKWGGPPSKEKYKIPFGGKK